MQSGRTLAALWRQHRLFVGLAGVLTGLYVSFAVHPMLGVAANALALIIFAGVALLHWPARHLALVAACFPLIHMVSLAFPDPQWRQAIYYAAMLVLTLGYWRLFRHRPPLRAHLAAKDYALVVVVGVALGVVWYWASPLPAQNVSLLLVVLAILGAAVAEELLFRGLLQEQAERVLPPKRAIVLSALAYALAASWMMSLTVVGLAAITGLVLAGVFYTRKYLRLSFILNVVIKTTAAGVAVLWS